MGTDCIEEDRGSEDEGVCLDHLFRDLLKIVLYHALAILLTAVNLQAGRDGFVSQEDLFHFHTYLLSSLEGLL
jgi:hypothetical protein